MNNSQTIRRINYGVMTLLLRQTYPEGYGGGQSEQVNALARSIGIHPKTSTDHVSGVEPNHSVSTKLRRTARKRLTIAQCRQCGMVIECRRGDPVGVDLSGGLPIDLDFALLVGLLAEKYTSDLGLSHETGIRQDILSTYERSIREPRLHNALTIINVAMRRLTQYEFDQCSRSYQAQAVAA